MKRLPRNKADSEAPEGLLTTRHVEMIMTSLLIENKSYQGDEFE